MLRYLSLLPFRRNNQSNPAMIRVNGSTVGPWNMILFHVIFQSFQEHYYHIQLPECFTLTVPKNWQQPFLSRCRFSGIVLKLWKGWHYLWYRGKRRGGGWCIYFCFPDVLGNQVHFPQSFEMHSIWAQTCMTAIQHSSDLMIAIDCNLKHAM